MLYCHLLLLLLNLRKLFLSWTTKLQSTQKLVIIHSQSLREESETLGHMIELERRIFRLLHFLKINNKTGTFLTFLWLMRAA